MSAEPSRYVQPEVSDARVERLWSQLSERLEQRRSPVWRGLLLAGALAGAAAAGALLYSQAGPKPSPSAVLSGERLETHADSMSVTLLDGSKLQLGPRSELAVRQSQPAAVKLALSRGQADLDVEHVEGRSFTVVAGDVQVRVVGTRFSVKSTPEGAGSRIEVSVLRGAVEVLSARRPGIVERVAAGQSWIQLPQSLADARTEQPQVTPPAGPEAPGKSSAPEVASVAGSAAPVAAGARELFEKAGERRRSGDAAGAAQAYEELLKVHPSDARASLAAFELGRLRMDRLGDSAGAIPALERAVALNVGPTFREDALARLVSVYAKLGNFAACARARDRYLASYPSGVHATAVGTRCGAR